MLFQRKKKIGICEGRIQYGWTIWEWPRIMIEAEFHAIWISPDNIPIDITPNEYNVRRILFLPDDTRQYDFNKEGMRIDNVRRPLCDNQLVHDFIKIAEEIYAFEEKRSMGREIHLEGPNIDFYNNLLRTKARIQLQIKNTLCSHNDEVRRNDPCPCGSGKKYKKCCGK